jgi:hypothetical protein
MYNTDIYSLIGFNFGYNLDWKHYQYSMVLASKPHQQNSVNSTLILLAMITKHF